MKYRIIKRGGYSTPYKVEAAYPQRDGTIEWQYKCATKYLWTAKLALKELIKENNKPGPIVVYEIEA